MLVYGFKNTDISKNDIFDIAQNLGVGCIVIYKSSNCRLIKLKRLNNDKYQRTGFIYSENLERYNKVNSVCWHGFRDFIKKMYDLNENFRFVTATATYKNKDHFNEIYPNTAFKNIGSIAQPMYFENACLCS
tara:strand:- start:45 stop:440 length:396 start_codon:yes stop_codon:yes gene_type:complete